MIKEQLKLFYQNNQIPNNGGYEDKTFKAKFLFFTLTVPNPKFRRKVIHIHDIHHLLCDKDITWKGEAYIAGWEIATKIWKHFPVIIFSLSAFGFALIAYPKEVFKGFKEGSKYNGPIDLPYTRNEILNMELSEVRNEISRNKPKHNIIVLLSFGYWILMSFILILSPVFTLGLLIYYFM